MQPKQLTETVSRHHDGELGEGDRNFKTTGLSQKEKDFAQLFCDLGDALESLLELQPLLGRCARDEGEFDEWGFYSNLLATFESLENEGFPG